MLKKFQLIIYAALLMTITSHAQSSNVTIKGSKPTHYFYTPMARVNPAYHLVVGLHEISFALPANLQLQASLLDNIGRINFGAKYGLADNMAIGAGMAYTLIHIGNGHHGIPEHADPRLGIFLAYEPIQSSMLNMVLVPHTQIGDRVSLGGDFGLMYTPTNIWSLIWEIGTSFDLEDEHLYFNTDGGIRIHPPALSFLFFDMGIDLEEFPITAEHVDPEVGIYIDVMFAIDTN